MCVKKTEKESDKEKLREGEFQSNREKEIKNLVKILYVRKETCRVGREKTKRDRVRNRKMTKKDSAKDAGGQRNKNRDKHRKSEMRDKVRAK